MQTSRGDVFIPSHSADSVSHSEDLLTWHSLTHIPRERLSPVFMKPAGSPPSERPLCFTAAKHLLKYFPHMWRSVYMCTYGLWEKSGARRGKERGVFRRQKWCVVGCLNSPVWFGCTEICLTDSPRLKPLLRTNRSSPELLNLQRQACRIDSFQETFVA